MNFHHVRQFNQEHMQEQINEQGEKQQTVDYFLQARNEYKHLPPFPPRKNEIPHIESDQSIQTSVELIMKKIQLLEYQKTPYIQLCLQFKSILHPHIGFKQLLPHSKDQIGKKLIQDGLFHELWGIICMKVAKRQQMQNYYEQYYNLISTNHSNFQRLFNSIDSSKELSKQVQNDTATNLFPTKKAKNTQQDSQQTKKMKLKHYSNLKKAPSFFDHIQTNQRRLKAQMACYYLNLTSFYNLVDLNINTIFQFYQQDSKQLLILSAQVPQFSEQLGRQVMDYRQKTLLAMYGYISLRQLLRIKTQYLKIDGFILYDELHNLNLWLKNNAHGDCF